MDSMELLISIIAAFIIALLLVVPSQAKKALKSWWFLISGWPKSWFSSASVDSSTDIFLLLGIEDIRPEFLFHDAPLDSKNLSSVFHENQWIDYPTQFADLFSERIKARKEKAGREGRTFDNNLSYSLRRVDVNRPEGSAGGRENKYTLHLYPTDYEHFIFPNTELESRIYSDITNTEGYVRELTGLTRIALRFSNLENLPFHFKVGVGTIFVTRDRYMVVSIRSKRELIAPGDDSGFVTLHLSAAEGMFRSESDMHKSDTLAGMPSPFATGRRALLDELGIRENVDYDVEKLGCLGMFMDTLRAQPFFILYVESEQLRIHDVLQMWENGPKDKHENESIFGLRMNMDNVLRVLYQEPLNALEYVNPPSDRAFYERMSNSPVRPASNHAATGFVTALRYKHGSKRVQVSATRLTAERTRAASE
jgi:hypothetical protein